MGKRTTEEAEGTGRPRAVKLLSATDLDKAYKRGIVSIEEYEAHLKKLGYEAKDIKIKVKLAEAEKPLPVGEIEATRNLTSFESDIMSMSKAIRG